MNINSSAMLQIRTYCYKDDHTTLVRNFLKLLYQAFFK